MPSEDTSAGHGDGSALLWVYFRPAKRAGFYFDATTTSSYTTCLVSASSQTRQLSSNKSTKRHQAFESFFCLLWLFLPTILIETINAMEVETFTTRRISERRNADVEEKNTVDDVESLSNGSVAGESKSSGTDGEKESSSVSSSNTPTSTSGQASSTGLDGMVVNRNEDRGINSARYCFFFILLVASVAIGTTVYMVTSNEEKQDYQADVSRSQLSFWVWLPAFQHLSLTFVPCMSSLKTQPRRWRILPTKTFMRSSRLLKSFH